MTVWLCSWIGMALLHDFSHAVHLDEHHTPCAVCHLLHQSAPAAINTELAVRAVPVFECISEIETETTAFHSQISLASTSPRGPPALLVV